MKIYDLNNIPRKVRERVMNRSFGQYRTVLSEIEPIIQEVKKRGDRAIFEKYESRTSKKIKSLLVARSEIKKAYRTVDKNTLSSIKQAAKNITRVHETQYKKLKKEEIVRPEEGISVSRTWRPIERVGLYIPGGKALYPSSVLMSAIPARITGCNNIIMTTPPDENFEVPSSVLVAADIAGVDQIYKVGGVQAIAALAYGTKSIPRVFKIFGAGNAYVTAAKMSVFGEVDIDMPAGPSEVFVIADEGANPAFIAADLLADGEHGDDSACVLITTSKKVAKRTIAEINVQMENLPTAKRVRESLRQYGLIAVVSDIDEAIEFCNEYAPEHLTIMTKNPRSVVKKITNAGSVFLGKWTSKSAGDYATGANHVLPTGGMTKMFAPLSVESFGKLMQVQECTREGLSAIRQPIETLSDIEGLPAHKFSCAVRFKDV